MYLYKQRLNYQTKPLNLPLEISFFPSHLCVATAAIVVGNLRFNLWATSVAQLKSFRGQLNFVSSIKNGNGQRQCPAMMAPVRSGSHENNCVIGAQVGGGEVQGGTELEKYVLHVAHAVDN